MSEDKRDGPRDDAASTREAEPSGARPRQAGFRDIARRLFREEGDPSLRSDVKDAVVAALATGDKAKTEMVRMVAREVRAYLEELKIKEDLQELVTNHSLEFHASVHLKPLAGSSPQASEKVAPAAPETVAPVTAAPAAKRKRTPKKKKKPTV